MKTMRVSFMSLLFLKVRLKSSESGRRLQLLLICFCLLRLKILLISRNIKKKYLWR